jgi:hypothetical protein
MLARSFVPFFPAAHESSKRPGGAGSSSSALAAPRGLREDRKSREALSDARGAHTTLHVRIEESQSSDSLAQTSSVSPRGLIMGAAQIFTPNVVTRYAVYDGTSEQPLVQDVDWRTSFYVACTALNLLLSPTGDVDQMDAKPEPPVPAMVRSTSGCPPKDD